MPPKRQRRGKPSSRSTATRQSTAAVVAAAQANDVDRSSLETKERDNHQEQVEAEAGADENEEDNSDAMEEDPDEEEENEEEDKEEEEEEEEYENEDDKDDDEIDQEEDETVEKEAEKEDDDKVEEEAEKDDEKEKEKDDEKEKEKDDDNEEEQEKETVKEDNDRKEEPDKATNNITNDENNTTTNTTTTSNNHKPRTHHKNHVVLDDNDLVLTSSKRRGVYECDYCHGDISQLPRIRCAVCEDFDLCLDCFAANVGGGGAETVEGAHNPQQHGYRVCDSTRFPIFPTARQWSTKSFGQCVVTPTTSNNGGGDGGGTTTTTTTSPLETSSMDVDEEDATNGDIKNDEKQEGDEKGQEDIKSTAKASRTISYRGEDPKLYWTVEEDLRLLEGISTHGIGNWVEIAEIVAGQGAVGKTPKRCMERYLDDFLGRYGQILPPYTLVACDENNDNTAATTNIDTTPDDMNNNNDNNGGNANQASSATSSVANAATAPLEATGDAMSSTDSVGDAAPTSLGVSRSSTPGPATSDTGSTTAAEDMPRSSKRRAALFRSPSSVVTPTYASNLASRKRYKVVPTETTEGYSEYWPKPYFPSQRPHVVAGGEVGRDQMYKAEQNYVKLIGSATNEEEVEAIHEEWKTTKLNTTNGPTVLPPRPEDVMTMPGAELAGFMPRRGDFDIEWENDAEENIGDMEFLPGDSQEDRKLKLKVLEIYNSKLDQREARKQFIISRRLWDYRKLHQDYETLPRDERDLAHRMRLFERFHTPEEHKIFLDDILRAKRLRKEIAKLQMYRRLGIRTLVEAEKYELDKNRRQFHKLASATAQTKDAQRKNEEGAGKSDDGSDAVSLWKKYRPNDRRSRKSVNRGNSFESNIAASSDASCSPATKSPATGGDKSSDPMEVDPAKPALEQENESGENQQQTSKDSLPAPTLFLTSQEVDLCNKIGLTHEQYRDIKKVLIQESLTAGLLDKEGAGSSRRALIKMDVERRGNLIDFFLRAGWVSTRLSHIARSLPQSQPQS